MTTGLLSTQELQPQQIYRRIVLVHKPQCDDDDGPQTLAYPPSSKVQKHQTFSAAAQ